MENLSHSIASNRAEARQCRDEKLHTQFAASALFLLMMSTEALAQSPIYQPTFPYAGGVLGVQSYVAGSVDIPTGKQFDFGRIELNENLAAGTVGIVRAVFLDVDGSGYGYGSTILAHNHGSGLANGDYVRVEAAGGTGPVIAHKTAVRGDSAQWAVWGHQVNLGPGAKAAFWVTGDNPQLEGRLHDDVPYIMVVDDAVNPTQAVIQWNANQNATGRMLRVFRANQLVMEVTADGTVRAKRFEVLP